MVCQLSIWFLCFLQAENENISSEYSSRRIFQKAELFVRNKRMLEVCSLGTLCFFVASQIILPS